MNIFSLKGHRVKVTESSAKNGTDYDTRKVKDYLEIDKIYKVERTEVGAWRTDVYLQEIPDVTFNSVNFESITVQPKELDEAHPDYKKYN